MKRGRRLASSLFIVAALLFSQWATASYVCAMLVPPAVEAAHPASPCPDMGTPNTCEQHCAGLNAATDSGKPPSLPQVTDFTPLRIELVGALAPRIAFEARRHIPPDPPPAVRYSVLRI